MADAVGQTGMRIAGAIALADRLKPSVWCF
jgi:hypothetical protein